MTPSMATWNISESARERETFRHDPTLLSEYRYNDTGGFIPSLKLSATADPILAALAQLGACRTRASRAFICLFDQARQYIIAEATPTSFLRADTSKHGATSEPLWLQGSAIPRSNGICEQFLNRERSADNGSDSDLPVNVVADIHSDPNVSEESCTLLGTATRGYVGVPIRSKNGIDFGEYSIVTERPLREGEWTDADSRILREISKSILDHLLSKIPQLERIRAEKKISGIRSFVEQRPPIVDLRHQPLHDMDEVRNETDTSDENIHSSRNVDRDFLQPQLHSDLVADGPSHLHHPARVGGYSEEHGTLASEFPYDHTPPRTPPQRYSGRIEKDPLTAVFSKAANIIRESFDADGVAFFDASVSSFNSSNKHFRGSDESQCPSQQEDESWSSDDSDADSRSARNDIHIITSSTSGDSMAEQEAYSTNRREMSFKALSALLRRYPRGGVFDFDETGNLESGHSSRDSSQPAAGAGTQSPRLVKRRTLSFIGNLSNEISKSFPGARSVAFVPVYDQVKKRWRAGCFAYTMDKTRFFTAKADISYLRAFATLAMADIANQEAHLTSQAQSDVLGSLSHELRSPLHGIILGVEFLTDSPLSVFQGNLLHILETCGRTLSDTIDHLLYYAKVNNFIPPGKTAESRARGLRKEMNNTLQAGMKSITAPVRIDVLVEEVTESIFAGFNFQRMSIGQLERDQRKSHADIYAMRRSDNLQAAEDLGHLLGGDGGLIVPPGHVVIDLDIDPLYSHHYYGISGAIRRIVMNMFGNALKFTTFGSIRVALSQEPIRRKKARVNDLRWAKIVVADTGKGISEDFLNNHLFLEFQQEDPITPGLGLGLSVVKKIVSSLRGKVYIESKVGVGTTATVLLPLQPVSYSFSLSASPGFGPDDFAEHRSQLKGLRACLVGFGAPLGLPNHTGQANDRQSIWNVCQRDLAMEVISTTQAMALAPDIVLCEEAALYDSFVARGELRKPPRVVVCVNALSAYRLSLDPRFQDPSTITEFISQPTGPRKIAKILVAALQQWVERQDRIKSPGNQTPLTLPLVSPLGRHRLDGKDKSPRLPSPGPVEPPAVEPPRRALSPSVSPLSSPHPAQEVSPPASPKTRPPPEFLLVEDNAINMKILCAYMKKLGQSYVTAEDGQAAVDRFRERPGRFRCVLMDINMPRLDGLQATRQIRELEAADHRLAPSTVIALTGLASADVQQDALDSGIDLFLTKTVKLQEISQILRSRGLT